MFSRRLGLHWGRLELVSTGSRCSRIGLPARPTPSDCFAAALMRKAQLPTAHADLLLAWNSRGKSRRRPAAKKLGSPLSSPPETALRAGKLKLGQVDGC